MQGAGVGARGHEVQEFIRAPYPLRPPPSTPTRHPLLTTPPFSGQPQESINNIDLLRANNKHTHTQSGRLAQGGGEWK